MTINPADLLTAAPLAEALERLRPLNLGDYIYDVRETVDLEMLSPDQSSWDHPDVIEFSDAITGIDKALADAQAIAKHSAELWRNYFQNELCLAQIGIALNNNEDDMLGQIQYWLGKAYLNALSPEIREMAGRMRK